MARAVLPLRSYPLASDLRASLRPGGWAATVLRCGSIEILTLDGRWWGFAPDELADCLPYLPEPARSEIGELVADADGRAA